MKFVDSSAVIIPQSDGLDGIYKQIELAARTAYKSENNITEDSAKRMVDSLIKANHGACLEHGTVYLTIPKSDYEDVWNEAKCPYSSNPYSWVEEDDDNYYITTNLRVLVDNGWLSDLECISECTEHHHRRVTVKFICSIGICREILRHRKFSFLNESTRYCNYSKDKFDNQLTCIIPQWIYDVQQECSKQRDWPLTTTKSWLLNYKSDELITMLTVEDRTVSSWYTTLLKIEDDYLFTTKTDESYRLKAEEARGILPLDLKSELIVTGFIEDWKHFFNLRSHIAMTGKPHPDIQVLADKLLQDFVDNEYINPNDLYKKE